MGRQLTFRFPWPRWGFLLLSRVCHPHPCWFPVSAGGLFVLGLIIWRCRKCQGRGEGNNTRMTVMTGIYWMRIVCSALCWGLCYLVFRKGLELLDEVVDECLFNCKRLLANDATLWSPYPTFPSAWRQIKGQNLGRNYFLRFLSQSDFFEVLDQNYELRCQNRVFENTPRKTGDNKKHK